MSLEVRIPPLGESVSEGVIARWLKKDGDVVRAGEPILELETDKATLEIPADAAGRLEIVEREGATVRVGTVVARIAEGAPAGTTASVPGAGPAAQAQAGPAAGEGRADASVPAAPRGPEPAPPLSPAVRRLVEEHDLDPGAIPGTGKGGRLTRDDVLRHLDAERPAPATPRQMVAPRAAATERAVAADGGESGPTAPTRPRVLADEVVERAPMTALRRRIAERLVEAQQSAAILTTFNEVDCASLLAVRQRYRERFRVAHGVDLGLMSLFGRAVVLALGDVPVVNARIDGGEIVYHRHVHLGIAVSTSGGLVVPVVRHAHAMTLAELERAIGDLARLAREGRLVPDQLSGGTFSITNGGVFGSLLSTPILNPPQSGILGMHKIQERPVAVDGQVVIRPMMYVALSYDHRLVDGAQAVTFLVRVKERLEDPVRMLLEV